MLHSAVRQRLVSRDDYERMIAAGLFQNERVELLSGIIVEVSPQHEPHAQIVQILTRLLVPPLLGRADVRVQLPFPAGSHSMPEPDLTLVAVARFGEPRPDRAFLVIEVADSSLAVDRTDKAEIYAAAGVAEYWIVNIPDRAIEVHTEPLRDAYTRLSPYRIGDKVAPVAFPDVLIDVGGLFGAGP
jgi:Uma2 family endonuclease